MHSSVRLASRFGALIAALAAAGVYGGCGDLILPTENDRDASANNPEDDGGTNPELDGDIGGDGDLNGGGDGSADARAARLDCTGQDASFGPPADLGCTGLYSDWPKRVIAAEAVVFDPGLHLWSDGAEKTRWIFMPAGQKIDSSDMNEWKFPVGTKLWKEFKLSGQRVETRMFWKRGLNDWVRTTYRWSADEQTATSLSEGQPNVGGTTYAIPPVATCDACHSGRIDKILGFDAVSLSSPESKYGTTTPAIDALVALLTNPTPAKNLMQVPDDGTGKGRLALGWLHANCGSACHNNSPSSFAGATGLFLRLEVTAAGTGAYTNTDTYQTSVCKTARFTTDIPTGSANWTRIRPGEPFANSLVPFRDSKRNNEMIQMPPVATSIPDLEGSKWVQDWVTLGSFPVNTTNGKCAL